MILIDIEMPKSCADCIFSVIDFPNNVYVAERKCRVRGCKCDNETTRPLWCPLSYTNGFKSTGQAWNTDQGNW